ncbi:unnamed protein product [Lactuca virosa]|uniref:Uncharacterized protein n=1 Tax=Lactuca virosa TaxID=75947 RepID=A0AAU9M3D2_9ASTR|nr:unnamed protein product [Lactuca virosa]
MKTFSLLARNLLEDPLLPLFWCLSTRILLVRRLRLAIQMEYPSQYSLLSSSLRAWSVWKIKKEGIFVGVTSRVMRKTGLLSIAALSDATKGKTFADRSRRRKLATDFISTLFPSSEDVIKSPPVHRGKSLLTSETSDYDYLIAIFQGNNLSSSEASLLTVGARHIRHLKSVAVKLRVNDRGLQQHVASLESLVESSRQKL